jgi:aspartyl-tRNA(Asn)/glutamyl-tRNA(Gln) amidotransferase subunit A
VTADGTTTCASGFLKNYRSPFEASVVREVRKGNWAVKEKTNMDEFGMGSHSTHSHFGPVSNKGPWNHRSAGGSSGGSAVALASSVSVNLGLGTDTGGSVRLPAAYTGTIGFKPSYGKISRWGVIPYANSLDTVGFIVRGRNAEGKYHPRDYLTAVMNQISDRHDPRDPTSLTNNCRARIRDRNAKWERRNRRSILSEKGQDILRIGVPVEYNIEELQPIIRDAWIHVLEELQDRGHTIVPVSLPTTKHALSAYYVLAAAEAASNLAKYDGVRYGTYSESSDGAGTVLYDEVRGNGFGDEVKRRILLGSYTLSSEAIDNYFIQAQKMRRLVQRDFDRIFAMPNPLRPAEQFDLSDMDETIELKDKFGPAQVDVLVCPTAPTLPPRLVELEDQSPVDSYMNDVFTVPASLAGLPAISVPIGVNHKDPITDDLPFAGIQVIGQYSNDDLVIKAGCLIHGLPPKRVVPKVTGTGSKIRKILH